MKKIFVTGAPGWLGNRFVELVSQKKFPEQKESYAIGCLVLEGLNTKSLERENVEIVRGDVRSAESLKGAMEGCDYLVHMVGIIHPKNVKEFYEINTQGTENVIREALASGVKKMVHVSSNSVAGFSSEKHFTEEDAPKPYMHYGKSKYEAEKKVLEAASTGKMEAVILRPCWYYGPGQPARQTKFFKMIKKGNPLMFGSGNNYRSVSYVDSVALAIMLAIEKEGINKEIFWIADEKQYTSNEIYGTIAKILNVPELKPRKIPGFSSWIFEQADRVIQSTGMYQQEIHVAGEMSRNIACRIDKAKKVLGYKPLTTLEEGMKNSLEWCRKNGIDV